MVLHVGVGDGQQEQAAALLSQEPNIANVNASNGYMEVSLKDGINDYSFIAPRLLNAGFNLKLLKEEEVNLETAFMRLTKGMVQ
jgi:ABC-2 type transport system ATP-binding protein